MNFKLWLTNRLLYANQPYSFAKLRFSFIEHVIFLEL